MTELQEARAAIREVDEAMAELFVRRMKAVEAVAEYKRAHGLPVYDPAQEEAVLRRGAELAPEGLRGEYRAFQRDLMETSRRYQHRLLEGRRVAYNGVEGAFAHIAARDIFPDGVPVAHGSFESAYAAVVSGDCDCAVLPIENSYAGEVGQVVDLMFRGSLFVSGVYALKIRQNLLGTPDAAPEDVKTVLSHPQALAQCARYLAARGLVQQTAGSTADAARTVAERGDKTLAAIASRETAELYGLKVLDHDVNEDGANTTRFAVFSRGERRPPAGENSTGLLLFTVSHVAGALAKAIGVIGDHGFNMKALRSRPMKTLPWNYYFYVEAEGDLASGNGKEMLSELRRCCQTLKVAGSYARERTIGEGEAP